MKMVKLFGFTFLTSLLLILSTSFLINATDNVSGVIINNGASVTNSSKVVLSISSPGATYMAISNTDKLDGVSWEKYSESKSWTLNSGEGKRTVYIKFKNASKEISSVYSDDIIVDTSVPPTGKVVINDGSDLTNNTNVNLSITATEDATNMMVSEDKNFTGAAWAVYSSKRSFNLSSGDGKKTVYVKLKDSLGSISSSFSFNITLDTTAPAGEIYINSKDSDKKTNNVNVKLVISSRDAKEIMVSNLQDFTNSVWEKYVTNKTWTLTSGDGQKTVYIKFKDEAGNISTVYSDSITLATAAPTGSISINGGQDTTNSTSVILTISAPGSSQMIIANDEKLDGRSWEAYSESKNWTLTSGDGTKIVYVKFKDKLGNVSRISNDSIVLETSKAPTGKITINNGAQLTNNTKVSLAITASQDAQQMMIGNDTNYTNAVWEQIASSKDWILTTGDGKKTVYVKFKDKLGSISSSFSSNITLDTTAPTGEIYINSKDRDKKTNNVNVKLVISSKDAKEMMVSNAQDFANAVWEKYTTSKDWTLTSGDGKKTVYIKFRDEAGNVSTVYSDSITLATAAPTGSISINGGQNITNSTSVKLAISAPGSSKMMVANNEKFADREWETYSESKNWTLTSGDGTKTVYVKFKDKLGNISSTYNDSTLLDTKEPKGSIAINNGSTQTNNRNVTLTITSNDTDTKEMIISESSSFTGTQWEPFTATKTFTLSSGDGNKTVYLKLRDSAQNVSRVYSANIRLKVTAPSGKVEINNGAAETNNVNVKLSISASNAADMLISNNKDFGGASWEKYSQTKDWMLTTGDDVKIVYVKFRDSVGNVSIVYADAISLCSTK